MALVFAAEEGRDVGCQMSTATNSKVRQTELGSRCSQLTFNPLDRPDPDFKDMEACLSVLLVISDPKVWPTSTKGAPGPSVQMLLSHLVNVGAFTVIRFILGMVRRAFFDFEERPVPLTRLSGYRGPNHRHPRNAARFPSHGPQKYPVSSPILPLYPRSTFFRLVAKSNTGLSPLDPAVRKAGRGARVFPPSFCFARGLGKADF